MGNKGNKKEMKNQINILEENDIVGLSSSVMFDDKGNKKKICRKHYMVVSKPQYIIGNIQDICKSKETIKQYAYILHDKDKDTEPHYHIYLNFGRASVPIEKVAGWFGLEPQFVEIIKDTKVSALKYLTHSNESQKNKYQYDVSEVVANFDFQAEIKASDILGDFENYSYAKQLTYIFSLPKEEQIKYYKQLEMFYQMYTKKLIMSSSREIKVLFLCGSSGSGKTYNAKKIVESLDYDYCVSSSSNDPFQDYLGQNAIILDDLRDDCFSFVDLLKVLDNHTSSSVKSRFSNKVFRGKCIVITSSVPLDRWYVMEKSNGKLHGETLNQLYRRITTYYNVTEDFIYEFEGVQNNGKPKGEPFVYENPVKYLKKEEKEVKKRVSFLEGIYKRVEEPLKDIFELEKINKVF